MKNKFFYLGALLAVGTAFTACSNDELLQDMPEVLSPFDDGRISFVQRTGNMTKAAGDNRAQNNGHYEFGVYGVLGTIADQDDNNTVMKNYLVAYGKNDLYKDIYAANSSTAGENAFGDMTDAADGLSTWFYEGIGKGTADAEYTYAHTLYTTPDNNQILKYWTKGSMHHFFAYMPYAAAANAAYTADKLALKNLHSFYTTPVEENSSKVQPTNAVVAAANAIPTQYDNEMLNYNEALYAYNKQNGDNTADVHLDFKHINSKIQIAFYEVIKGYSVEIIDVKPSDVYTSAPYAGIAFSTATKAQANTPMTETQPTTESRPQYDREATATVSSMSATPAVAMSDQVQDKANLRFQKPAGTIATSNAAPTLSLSPTVYYAIPQTPTETGLTLHISYKLHPADGASDITIYDARCYVAPEYLHWEPGKAYKYIFKITDKSNGVTNPNQPDPATPGEPWVDPEDPRVPDEPALQPIVFDGVTVTDYENAATGKTDDTDEWNVSETAVTNAFDWLIKSGYTIESSSIKATEYNVTITATAEQLTAKSVWNDLSRVLGALHQYSTTSHVTNIKFDGDTYDWQTATPTFLGSNWTKTGQTATESSTDVNRLLVNAFNKLTLPTSFIEEVISGGTKKVTSRISMNLNLVNEKVVPFTVTVVIPDYPVTPAP